MSRTEKDRTDQEWEEDDYRYRKEAEEARKLYEESLRLPVVEPVMRKGVLRRRWLKGE